jgi:hypothetical protein
MQSPTSILNLFLKMCMQVESIDLYVVRRIPSPQLKVNKIPIDRQQTKLLTDKHSTFVHEFNQR